MGSHLVRRGGIWWARLVVPARLREAAGRREFIQSCRTHELAIAKLVAAVFLADWRRLLLRLESVPMSIDVLKLVEGSPVLAGGGWVTLAEAESLSGVSQNQLLRAVAGGSLKLFCRTVQVAGHDLPFDVLELTSPEAGLSGGVVIPQSKFMPSCAIETTRGGVLAVHGSSAVASDVLAGRMKALGILLFEVPNQPGMVFAPDAEVRLNTERFEVQGSEVEALRKRLRSHVSEDVLERAQALQKVAIQGAATAEGKKAHKRFSEGLAAFAKEALPQSNKNPKERARIRNGIGLFVELVGDLKLCDIDVDTLRAFRDGPLATVPARLNHAEIKFKTKGVKETITAIRKSGESWPVMSAAERDQRMTWLCRMFGWLTGEWLRENPAANLRGVSVLSKSERKLAEQNKKGRQPFTQNELNLIFSQSWFQTGDGKLAVGSGVNRKWSPMEYWLPLLSLHAGQRIRELCQLHLSDVRQTGAGIWYLDINEATPDKSLKNGESRRVVPVHPVLIDAGFIEWCERLRLEGFQRVFPDLIWEPTTGYAKEAKRRMSAMLLGLGMPRDNTKVFHSLRHTVNNGFIRLEIGLLVPEKIRLRVLGHKAGEDEGSTTYFADFEADENARFVKLLDFKLPTIAKFDADEGVKAIRASLARKLGRRKGRGEDMGPAVSI